MGRSVIPGLLSWLEPFKSTQLLHMCISVTTVSVIPGLLSWLEPFKSIQLLHGCISMTTRSVRAYSIISMQFSTIRLNVNEPGLNFRGDNNFTIHYPHHHLLLLHHHHHHINWKDKDKKKDVERKKDKDKKKD